MGTLDELVAIVARLRSEQGCPWDRAQTPQSMRPFLLEEAWEVDEALGSGDDRAQREELGDLLFVILLVARMAEERGAFGLDDVAREVAAKLVRRHPHVFGDAAPAGLAGWEAIKAAERAERSAAPVSALDGVPRGMPALLRAQQVGRKAAAVGFDWPDVRGPRAKLDEEIRELDEARGRAQVPGAGRDASDAVAEELGDVLFSVVNVARHLGLSAEVCLTAATDKFERRFRALEDAIRSEGGDPRALDATALEARWQAAKVGS